MAITIERNKKIQSLQIIDNIYVCVCVCVCDYTTEKYKKKMCYHKKNNSDVKTFERSKNIKESYDLLSINFWNKTKCIWLHNREI